MSDNYAIRFVKLHFMVQFIKDCILPKNKVSALRGGMGEMLLQMNCIRDRDCDSCDFRKDCLVQKIMYSEMEIPSKYKTAGESVGYIIECEDYHEFFSAGTEMPFNLVLFGKTILYFNQILNAFYSLGHIGIGKDKARYEVVSVTNTQKKPILQNNDILMQNYAISTVRNYVEYRRKQIENKGTYRIKFKSPTAIKYQGEELKEFQMTALVESLKRRVYTLDCFEGIESSILDLISDDIPDIISQNSRQISVKRYSFHKNSSMYLRGIEGEIIITELPEKWIDLLIAGELIHVGKNTSFGFGRFRIEPVFRQNSEM